MAALHETQLAGQVMAPLHETQLAGQVMAPPHETQMSGRPCKLSCVLFKVFMAPVASNAL
jgi:hypothetical protein